MAECRNCGTNIPSGNNACVKCGAGFKDGAATASKTLQTVAQSSASAHDQNKSPRRCSVESAMACTDSVVLDDSLSCSSADDVVLQLDTEKAERDLEAKLEREKAQRDAADARNEQERAIQAIARFGEAPAHVVASAVYAIRVLWRLFRIRSALLKLVERRNRADRHLRNCLRAVGEVIYGRSDSHEMEPYRAEIQAVTEAKQAVQGLHVNHQQVRSSYVGLMQEVMQAINEAQLRAKPFRMEESKLLEELGQYETIRQSQLALIQRADLEHKELIQHAVSKPDPSFLAAVEQERRKRQAQLDSIIDKIKAVNEQLGRVRSLLQKNTQEIDALHQQRKSLHIDRARDQRQHELTVGNAQTDFECAHVALGEKALAEDLKEVAQTEIARARMARETTRSIHEQIALHEEAKKAYDRVVFIRGLYVLGALFGVVMFVLVAVSGLLRNT